MRNRWFPSSFLVLILLIAQASCAGILAETLRPWPDNCWYWSQNGQPLLLIGGSDDDNLFQWPEDKLLPQLDRIAEAGGNVVRNTMSDRKDRGFERYPFRQLDDGRYDLTKWDDKYWQRFQRFLEETAKRKIVVQIELWDRFDYTDQRGQNHWQRHPYHPKNNINYTAESSGFADRYPDHPGANKQPFFFTTPNQQNNKTVLRFQEAFIDRVLAFTFPFGHVLYCIDNETKAEPVWGRYWAQHIKKRAHEHSKTVMVTEMWDAWDLTSEEHRATFDHPDLYDFVDVSQNNHNRSDKHWNNFLFVRRYLQAHPRPMNTTKTYGADGNKFNHTDQDAIERFWRHLLAGAASIRFHRPDSGLGINDKAVACLRAARLLEAEIPLWDLQPALHLLGERRTNEAFVAADGHRRLALFFPAAAGEKEREVLLDLSAGSGPYNLQWIDIDRGTRSESGVLAGGAWRTLRPPNDGNLAATVIEAAP